MVKNGYFRDDYIHHFVMKCSRRTPLIHLGYYMRVLTVDFTLRSFLDATSGQPTQVNISSSIMFIFIWAKDVFYSFRQWNLMVYRWHIELLRQIVWVWNWLNWELVCFVFFPHSYSFFLPIISQNFVKVDCGCFLTYPFYFTMHSHCFILFTAT